MLGKFLSPGARTEPGDQRGVREAPGLRGGSKPPGWWDLSRVLKEAPEFTGHIRQRERERERAVHEDPEERN